MKKFLLVLVGIFVGTLPGYALAIIANTNCNTSATTCATTAKDITGAKLVVVAISTYNLAISASNVTDSVSNTFTCIAAAGTQPPSGLCYILNPVTSASYVLTGHYPGSGPITLAYIAFGTGIGTFVQSTSFYNGGGITVPTIQPGSITPTGSALFVSSLGIFGSSDTSCTVDTGFTITSCVGFNNGIAYKVSATAENPTWTVLSVPTIGLASVMATFSLPSSGIPPAIY